MKLTESEKRAALAALEALREAYFNSGDEIWCDGAIAYLEALPTAAEPTAPEPAPGFTAWVTRDAWGDASAIWVDGAPMQVNGKWRVRASRTRRYWLTDAEANVLLGDARGAGAIRRVRIVPDGEVGDE